MKLAQTIDTESLPAWARNAEERIRKNDRRRGERATIAGEGLAAFVDGEGGAKVCRIDFIDASGGGIGIRCGIAITPGSRFTIRPDSGLTQAVGGTVARCIQDGECFRLGLKLYKAAAA